MNKIWKKIREEDLDEDSGNLLCIYTFDGEIRVCRVEDITASFSNAKGLEGNV